MASVIPNNRDLFYRHIANSLAVAGFNCITQFPLEKIRYDVDWCSCFEIGDRSLEAGACDVERDR